MPTNVVLVRHGRTVRNEAASQAQNGDYRLSDTIPRTLHDSWDRLHEIGLAQAEVTGGWIRDNIGPFFDTYMVSPCYRAQEFAGRLALPGAQWRENLDLRERDWGNLGYIPQSEWPKEDPDRWRINPMFWRPFNGETLLEARARVALNVMPTLNGKRVIVVAHGEILLTMRMLFEYRPWEEWGRILFSDDPHDEIHNGQVIEYSSHDPVSGTDCGSLAWMRSTWPSRLTDSPNRWVRVPGPRLMSNEEMLRRVQTPPPF